MGARTTQRLLERSKHSANIAALRATMGRLIILFLAPLHTVLSGLSDGMPPDTLPGLHQ
jgi:hypothetical protein